MCSGLLFMGTESISGVYMVKNRINNKIYIGSSAFILRRIKSHLTESSNVNLKNDFIKMGIESFSVTFVELFCKNENETSEEFYDRLLIREQFYLDTILKANSDREYFADHAYNINYMANGPAGITRSAVTRAKYSASMYRRMQCEETKKRIQNTRLKNHNEKIIVTYGSMEAYKYHLKQLKRKRQRERVPVVGHGGIPIACYDENGVFIRKFNNQNHATMEVNGSIGNISRAITNKSLSYGKYWTLYTEDSFNGILIPEKLKYILKDELGNTLGEFLNVFAMSKYIKIDRKTIKNYLNKIVCDKSPFVPVGISMNKAEQRTLLRYTLINRNLFFQCKAFSKKNETLLLIKGHNFNYKDTKRIYKNLKNVSISETENSIQDCLTLSNYKFGKLCNRSVSTGIKIQRALNKIDLIRSDRRTKLVAVKQTRASFFSLALSGSYFLSKNGNVYQRLSNSLTIGISSTMS